MSEYIITVHDEPEEDGCYRLTKSAEPIVRCRDCRFSLAHGNGCGRNQDIYDIEPGGFCAWGERREDGEPSEVYPDRYWCDRMTVYILPDGFCSEARKKL